jgi:hypothetical protein
MANVSGLSEQEVSRARLNRERMRAVLDGLQERFITGILPRGSE